MATYGPGIDQSQHMKSVSHIIIYLMVCRYSCDNTSIIDDINLSAAKKYAGL